MVHDAFDLWFVKLSLMTEVTSIWRLMLSTACLYGRMCKKKEPSEEDSWRNYFSPILFAASVNADFVRLRTAELMLVFCS